MLLRVLLSPEALMAYTTCVVALGVVLVELRRSPPQVAIRRASWTMLIGTALVVLSATLSGSTGGGGRVNLVPGASILALDQADYRNAFENTLGNIVLFVPLGFFGLLAARRRVLVVTAAACALSIGIEVTQWVLGDRWTDVDDVLLNTFGAFLGAVTAVTALRVAARRQSGPG